MIGPLEERLRLAVTPSGAAAWADRAAAWHQHGEGLATAVEHLSGAARALDGERQLGARTRAGLLAVLASLREEVTEQVRRCTVTAAALTGAAQAVSVGERLVEGWDSQGPPGDPAGTREQQAGEVLDQMGRDLRRAAVALRDAHGLTSSCAGCGLSPCGCPRGGGGGRAGSPMGAGPAGLPAGGGAAGSSRSPASRRVGAVIGVDLPSGLLADGCAWLDGEEAAPGVLG